MINVETFVNVALININDKEINVNTYHAAIAQREAILNKLDCVRSVIAKVKLLKKLEIIDRKFAEKENPHLDVLFVNNEEINKAQEQFDKEMEAIFEEKFTPIEEPVDYDKEAKYLDAMGNLPNWEKLDKKRTVSYTETADGTTKKEIPSIQNYMYWFKEIEIEGNMVRLPVINPEIDVNAAFNGYVKKIDGVSEEGVLVKNGAVIVNGWFINGFLLKSACDGSAVAGSTRINSKAQMEIVPFGKGAYIGRQNVGETAAQLMAFFTHAIKVETDMIVFKPGDQLEKMVMKMVNTWINGVVDYKSHVNDLTLELTEGIIESYKDWMNEFGFFNLRNKVDSHLKAKAKDLKLNSWAVTKLENVVAEGMKKGLPLWSPNQACMYNMIPAPWEIETVKNHGEFKAGRMAKHRIREISEFCREFVKAKVQLERKLNDWVNDNGEIVMGTESKVKAIMNWEYTPNNECSIEEQMDIINTPFEIKMLFTSIKMLVWEAQRAHYSEVSSPDHLIEFQMEQWLEKVDRVKNSQKRNRKGE